MKVCKIKYVELVFFVCKLYYIIVIDKLIINNILIINEFRKL